MAVEPALLFAGDGFAAAQPRLRLAGEGLQGGAGFRRLGAVEGVGGPRHVALAEQSRGLGDIVERLARLEQALAGFIAHVFRALAGLFEIGEARQELRLPLFCGVGRFARLGQSLLRQARGLTGALVGFGRFHNGRLRRLHPGLGRLDRGASLRRLDFQLFQPVLFGKPPCGGGRRLGGLGEAVPAPQIAFDRDQALAGFQVPAQVRAHFARNQADLGEAAVKRGRGFHPFGQGPRASGQGRIAGALGEGPMGRGVVVVRGVEIVAQRRAQRRLVATRDD